MDEKVDVYKENETFQRLLSKYYKDRNEIILKDIWTIMFRCASNILKARFGQYWSWEKISDVAIDMTSLLIGRITNKEKYPNGYPIHNLPTMMKFAVLNCVYGPKVVQKEKEDSYEDVDSHYELASSYEMDVDEEGNVFYKYNNDYCSEETYKYIDNTEDYD